MPMKSCLETIYHGSGDFKSTPVQVDMVSVACYHSITMAFWYDSDSERLANMIGQPSLSLLGLSRIATRRLVVRSGSKFRVVVVFTIDRTKR